MLLHMEFFFYSCFQNPNTKGTLKMRAAVWRSRGGMEEQRGPEVESLGDTSRFLSIPPVYIHA